MVTGVFFATPVRAGDGAASGTAAQAGAIVFGLVVIQTDPAVKFDVLGYLQRIESIDAEGIRLSVSVGAAAVQAADGDIAVRMINIHRRRRDADIPRSWSGFRG